MTLHWHEMSGPEVFELSKRTDIALLPMGCVEMHGPHLPTGTDILIAEQLAELIAKRELAIILPTLPYNINDCMTCYPGTLAFPPDIVKGIISHNSLIGSSLIGQREGSVVKMKIKDKETIFKILKID